MAQGSMDSDRLSSAGISTHSSGTAGTIGGSVVGVRVGDPALMRQNENEFNLGPLPPMWEKAFTPSGEAYFIDHNSGTSHWLDPRLARVRKHSLGECGEDELPYGWERVTDERYGSYYVDHINRRTQYENPVLQARRLRAEKLAAENGVSGQDNGSTPTGELRGERFTLSLTKGTQGLGFTLIGAEGIPETEGYLQIRSIVPHSPAWIDGALRPGDVVVGVGARGVRGLAHAQVAQIFQSIPAGAAVPLHLVRGYPLSFDSEDPNTRVLSTLAVDAAAPPPTDASAMQQLTRALRSRFNLDSPNHVEPSPGRDETDTSPVTPHSPTQRRLMSRSFDLDQLPSSESEPLPPRCPSADHLLSLASEQPHRNGNSVPSEPGRELVLTLRKSANGFGFTIADSVHGQKVKKVLDRSRCAGLREGDLLLQIGPTDVRHAPHELAVRALKASPALQDAAVRVWRRDTARAPRSSSATRAQGASTASTNNQLASRSKTPTAEQLRSPSLHTQDSVRERLNGMNSVEATYAVPELKSERQSLIDRRRSSTPGGRLTLPGVAPWKPQENRPQWQENHQTGENRPQWQEPNHQNGENRPQWQEPNHQSGENRPQWQEPNHQSGENRPQWQEPNHQSEENPQWQEPNRLDDKRQQWQEPEHGNQWQDPGQIHGNQWQKPPHENHTQWQDSPQQHESHPQWQETNGQPNNQWQDPRPHGSQWQEPWIDNSTVRTWAESAQRWDGNGNGWDANGSRWSNGNWGEVSTPTVRVDVNAAYWRSGNASVADSSDNGGFPEDGLLHSPTTAAVSGLARQSPSSRHRPHSPSNSTGRLRSHSPSNASATDRLLANSPSTRLQSQSPSNNSSTSRVKGSPMRARESSPRRLHSPPCYAGDAHAQPGGVYVANYPQVEAGGSTDPEADVLVRLARGAAGFGFRIVGGIEDGSRVAVGYVVPGGPADGLLRPGDLLTSVDGIPLAGATHARAVAYVCQAASRGHVMLGVRHNRADIQSLGLPPHQPLLNAEPAPAPYSILHPAPLYPPPAAAPAHPHMYGGQYETAAPGSWAAAPYEVTVTRSEGEGFGFVVISSTNKATSTIGQLIPNSPAARCGVLHVGDTIVAINHTPIRNLPHPEVVALIKHSGTAVSLTVTPPDARRD